MQNIHLWRFSSGIFGMFLFEVKEAKSCLRKFVNDFDTQIQLFCFSGTFLFPFRTQVKKMGGNIYYRVCINTSFLSSFDLESDTVKELTFYYTNYSNHIQGSTTVLPVYPSIFFW